ncbi:hypothetical protein [Bradyrhizobium sp.]|uniref:hypothetical protein n=1 Tax=Bradyrhizobium sp. TaxID=376 RepID=UPI001D43D1B8|nr:hypothetical protein [Bradyrhizobium sp.]MBI5323111.1 hypothetical protein [Bradyrhizobium sp.]
MTRNNTLVSAQPGTSKRRAWTLLAGVFALAATLPPIDAWGLDSSPKQAVNRTDQLPLPPIAYLESMRWMSWKPNAPLFKVDTLLLPDGIQPGQFRLPSDYERDLPRVS